MPQVPWTELEPLQVQKLISALLVSLMTGAYAVEGSGGDDGADVVRPVDGGVHVYEIKSFTATLRPGQKSQVRKSLTTAREHRARMLLWTLVIPHDPTPAEERWLAETLAPLAGVPVAWMGRTQLEAAFAEHPHLARAFLPGSSQSRALELLAQYHQEQAGLAAGVPDAVERGGKLRELLAEVDPDFDFDLDLHAGETTIHVVPRDALHVRPPSDRRHAEPVSGGWQPGSGSNRGFLRLRRTPDAQCREHPGRYDRGASRRPG